MRKLNNKIKQLIKAYRDRRDFHKALDELTDFGFFDRIEGIK